jgi:hypothetical protein
MQHRNSIARTYQIIGKQRGIGPTLISAQGPKQRRLIPQLQVHLELLPSFY